MRGLAAFGLLAALAACQQPASTSSFTSAPPQEIETKTVVPAGLQQTWARLNIAFSRPPFEIEKVSERAKAFQVAVKTDRPSDFIDCGEGRHAYTSSLGVDKVYRYLVADSASYQAIDREGNAYAADRSTRLRAVSYLAATQTDAGTRVEVEVEYLLEVDTVYDLSEAGRDSVSETAVAHFSSNERSQGALECVSNGTVESMILNAARFK